MQEPIRRNFRANQLKSLTVFDTDNFLLHHKINHINNRKNFVYFLSLS
jgi:hypothetical protein